MRTVEQLQTGEIEEHFRMAFVGGPGEGKTHLAATFPGCIFAATCPGELDTVLNNPVLRKNLVGWEYFIPTAEKNEIATIEALTQFIRKEVRPSIMQGKCKTFVLDNATFLGEYFWQIISVNERSLYPTKSGAFDTQKAYGVLKDRLMNFFLKEIITLPCNVIINVHMQTEDDDKLAKMPAGSMPHVAAILGGFRDKLPAMMSYFFFLEKQEVVIQGKKTYSYNVYTNKGNGRGARSRLALPPIISDVTYEKINAVIKQARSL